MSRDPDKVREMVAYYQQAALMEHDSEMKRHYLERACVWREVLTELGEKEEDFDWLHMIAFGVMIFFVASGFGIMVWLLHK